jgi:hypothetical protein
MLSGSDKALGGGKYVYSPTSNTSWGGDGTPPTETGSATFSFTVPKAGTYAVWMRVQYKSVDENSVWVLIGENAPIKFGNEASGYGVWKWIGWQEGDPNQKVQVKLPAGPNTLTIIGREKNTKVASIVITDDLSYVPGTASAR